MAHRAAVKSESTPERFPVKLGERGRLVLPAPVRERLELNTGDRAAFVLGESGEVRLVSIKQELRKCRGMFAHLAPGRVLSEELIAERREEARREELE